MNKFQPPINDTFVRVNKVIGKTTNKELQRILRCGRTSVYDRLNGYRQFTQNDIIRLCEHYHCSADYLLFGKESV